jgi:hypothetical protein
MEKARVNVENEKYKRGLIDYYNRNAQVNEREAATNERKASIAEKIAQDDERYRTGMLGVSQRNARTQEVDSSSLVGLRKHQILRDKLDQMGRFVKDRQYTAARGLIESDPELKAALGGGIEIKELPDETVPHIVTHDGKELLYNHKTGDWEDLSKRNAQRVQPTIESLSEAAATGDPRAVKAYDLAVKARKDIKGETKLKPTETGLPTVKDISAEITKLQVARSAADDPEIEKALDAEIAAKRQEKMQLLAEHHARKAEGEGALEEEISLDEEPEEDDRALAVTPDGKYFPFDRRYPLPKGWKIVPAPE